MDPYIGKVLNERYEIQSLIGQGSTSVVYKAHCKRLDRTVAVKILNEELSSDENLLAKFYEESSKVAALSQANIVDIFDINQHQNIHYIVMEFLDGISLKQFIEYKHSLTWNETIYFSIQILKALEYAHAHGVVHRDLKPQNVIILRDGSVKVTDFAIAHLSTSQNTMSRSQLDTIYYLSPEQTNGTAVDSRSDLYSLGIMMYEMLTGKVPYSGTSTVSVAVQHVQGEAIPPRELQPNIPVGLQQITMHAMSSDIRYRYNTAFGMKKDLETLQQNPRVGFRYKEPVILPDKVSEEKTPEENTTKNGVEVQDSDVPDSSGKDSVITPETVSDVQKSDIEPTAENKPEESDGAASGLASEPEAADADLEDNSEDSQEDEENSFSSEEETAAGSTASEAFNTGNIDTEFPGLWDQFSEHSENTTEDEESVIDRDELQDDAEDYDDEEEYLDDEEEERKRSVLPIIIIVLIILILAALGYFFRSTVAEYAVMFWNIIQDFVQNL